MTKETKQVFETIFIDGSSCSMSRADIQNRLWDGRLDYSTPVLVEQKWVPLSKHPSIHKDFRGGVLSILRVLDGHRIPYCTLFVVLFMNLGNWFQDSSGSSIWGNSWSNVFLEGRWWSIFSGMLVHSSRAHFLSNVILILFLGWRVEKALGTWKSIVMLLCNLCVSSMMIWFVEGKMVVGASSLVFMLWGGQIAIGLFFVLPPRYSHRYGWWGLILLMVVFASQLRSLHLAHAVHIVSVLSGIFTVLAMYDRLHWRWIIVLFIGFCSGGRTLTSQKRVLTDGMSIVVPKDFLPHQAGNLKLWFHPFQTSGWLVQGNSSNLKELDEEWKKYEFETGFDKECMAADGCLYTGGAYHVRLRLVHFGAKKIYWIACAYPQNHYGWSTSCTDWIQQVSPLEPSSLRIAHEQSLRFPNSVYYLERYGLSLEDWGYYSQADQVYMRLLDSDWKKQGLEHRARIRQYLVSE